EVARRLRLLTPLAKLWTGRLAVAHASELIESIGGVAYVEDSGLPRLLRDAQVLPIWEGTTNVLALDVLKVLERGGGPEELTADLEPRLAGVARVPALTEAAGRVAAALASWRTAWRRAGDAGPELEAGARHLGIGLARCVAATLLLEQAAWELAA